MIEQWGAEVVVAHGTIYEPHKLTGFVAAQAAQELPIGLITYQLQDNQCEIVTLDSLQPRQGIGSALIEAVKDVAKQSDCERIWLITTNDNLKALRFYQKRGFTLAALHRNAIEQARKLKPQIPAIGIDGIPIRDEIDPHQFGSLLASPLYAAFLAVTHSTRGIISFARVSYVASNPSPGGVCSSKNPRLVFNRTFFPVVSGPPQAARFSF